MSSRRTVLTAIALIVTFLGASSASALAGVVHPVCAAKQHDCGKTTKIASCCCGGQSTSSEQSGPVQARAQTDTGTAVPAPSMVAPLFDPLRLEVAFQAHAAPRAASVDLTTLFSCLLI